MFKTKLKVITLSAFFGAPFFLSACTPQEQAFVTGVGVGAVATSAYSYPYYYNQPYYFYGGRYYYGGFYRGGYYHYRGHRYRNGHYYRGGYRYYNGRRYRAQVGRYGYYNSKRAYENRYICRDNTQGRSNNERGYHRDNRTKRTNRGEYRGEYHRKENRQGREKSRDREQRPMR